MKTKNEIILEHLKPLIGLKLAIARRASDLRNFQFGRIRSVENGTVCEYALHIQCPWRIESPDGIITGRSDLWEPAKVTDDFDWDSWNYENDENLQDWKISNLLEARDSEGKSYVNRRDDLIVENVQADTVGGATIVLTGGYKIVLFPDGSREEDWRFFRPNVDEPHFVICGGEIEDTE
jgi:hypothetical protein